MCFSRIWCFSRIRNVGLSYGSGFGFSLDSGSCWFFCESGFGFSFGSGFFFGFSYGFWILNFQIDIGLLFFRTGLFFKVAKKKLTDIGLLVWFFEVLDLITS